MTGIINRHPGKNTKSLALMRTSCVSTVKLLYNTNVSINAIVSAGVAPIYKIVGTNSIEMATPVNREITALINPAPKKGNNTVIYSIIKTVIN